MNGFSFLAIPILLLLKVNLYEAQSIKTINIAAGKPITATSTCGVGVSEPELYCKLASVPGKFGIKGLECDRCIPDSYSKDHAIKYAVDGSEKWWQSPPLSRGLNYQRVNITIDLKRQYQVAYVVIKTGNAPRPGVWSLERSVDNGVTFTPWQHFATSPSECRRYFGIETLIALTGDDSVKCSTEYSSIPPFENGEIHISLVTGRPGASNFSYSPTLQEWTRASHIRLRLMKVKTLLTDLLPLAREDPTVTRRYFYSIKDISVGAICMCNGHADQCEESKRGSAVEFNCRCKHNTCGPRCEKCCPSFVQKKWRPGTPGSSNECEACNCHQHSSECYYDPIVAQSRRSLDLNNRYDGGGVCVNCQHNTAGINCERCKEGYFNPTGIPKTSRDACRPCNCDPKYSTGRCYDGSGNCECKAKYGGARCDRCSEGFYGFPDCRPCDCNPAGTTGRVCGPTGNQCPCKPNFAGNKCDRCAPGYYGYPQCQRCNCDNFGAYDSYCDPTSGQCRCRQTYRSRQCNQCNRGFYSFPDCKPCNCDSEGTAPGICDPVFGRCVCLTNFAGARCDQCNEGYYRFPECIACGCSREGSVTPRCNRRGVCTCRDNYIGAKCENCKLGYYDYPRCIKCACDPRGAVHEICDLVTGQCTCKDDNRGLNCNQCKAGFYGFPNCRQCQCNPAGIKPISGRPFGDCSYSNDGQCDCKDNVQGLICSECKPGFHNLQSNNPRGCDACYCDLAGVVAGLANCDDGNGQCTCKQHVTGTRCNTCKVGYFGLEAKREFGCSGCNCDVGGSYDQVCDSKTGQCKCRPHVEGLDCSRPVKDYYYPDLLHVKAEVEDGCVPAPGNGVQGRDIPGRLLQSDPARQGDDTGNCNPIRYSFDEGVYPGFSWKGYVGFNALQKEIKVILEVPKTGRYHIIFNYALNDSNPVRGEISLSPRGQGSKQSSPVIFGSTQVGSTYVSGFTTAGEPGQPSQFMLTQGTWDLTFKAPPSKLLVDYISAVPQEYYQAYILQRKVTNPCIVNSQDPLCVQYSYINTIRPDFPTVELETGYIITRQGRQQTHVFDDKRVLEQLDFNAMAYLDRTQTRVTEDVNLPKVGDYVLVMQYYHPSDQTKTLDVYLRSRKSQQKGTFYLHSCRFKFGCRQVALDKDRRLKIFKANEIERRVITLLIDSDTSVAVDSITAIPLEQWNLDNVVPRPLCTTKNNKCISTSYPIPKGAVQYDVAADGSKPPPNILNPKTTLKYLEGETPYSVIYNNLQTGKYTIVVQYYQPKHVTFTSQATVTSDRAFGGRVQFDYCPNVEGCRAVVRNQNGAYSFDIGRPSGEFRMTVPRGSSAWIDYVLFIPQDRFSQEVADPNPVSFSKDFIVDCAKDSFFIKPSASAVCTKPVFSLATAFNNGTFPCECDGQGAVDSECKKFGGQCRCKQNVIGRKCNRCKTGYYGFPNCYKCQCVFCNEVTGACDCPTNTVGRNCELCLKGTYGYDPILGCQDCKCDVSGVIGGDVACDPVTGKCPCKPSHTGRRCNQCAPGRYGYPYCDKCDCDKRGVVNDVCDAKGTCLCKASVIGRRCDTCAAGFYDLDAKNPNGCTSCWCSGLSKICSSSNLKRFTVRQMDGWRMENTPAQVIKTDITTVMVSVAGKRTNPDKPIYWLAPQDYLGKQIYSYGGSLTYLLRFTVPVEVTTPVLTVHPDVIIRGKNGLEMTYKNQMTLQPNIFHKIQAHFNESLWSVANNSRSSRADVMSILADIESVRLRASYSTAVADAILSDVLLESALESIVGVVAKEIEKCVCPSKASGYSCELCGKGHTRGADNRTCVRCQCNGHSNDCHPETGECYNCLHNTAGDRCQTCIKGYYGNGTKGTPNDCQLCECPLGIPSNSFASECALDKSGQLTCVCNKGYTGLQCDQCADSYYGDPTIAGDYCKPCKCNGNIDPSVPGSCDPFTGVCTKCINKAFGDNCERCRDGYYGDAVVAKDCQKCQCSACGAMTSLCNYTSGACMCKENVIGGKCDTCKPNTWNFDSCLGCEDCNCGNASVGASCDVKTGQCVCKPGAIGRRCERCQAGFWNYKPEGCQVCNCPKGAENLWGFCDVNTGQCCKPGGNCTICPPNYILTPSGCEFCGECVGRLLDVAQGLDKNITTVLEYLKKGAAGVIAEAKYKDLNDTLNKLIPPTNKYSQTMESMSVIVGVSVVNGTANPRPLARYPLAKRTGGKDISNRGLVDAQLSNTDWVAGPDGPESAVQLQGNENSFVYLENNGKLHSKRSSAILLWVKHEGKEGPIMDFGFNKVRIWLVEYDSFEACFRDAQKPNCRKSQSTPRNEWIHLAMVYDYEAGMTYFWVDDQLADRSPLTSKSPLATDSIEVWMGAVPKVGDPFRGALACLQIFDQPLNAQQISVLKKACHPDFVQPVPGPDKSLLERTSESESKTNTMKEQASMVHKDAKESAKNATKTKTDAWILEQDIRDALNRSRSIINLSGSIVEKLQTGSENQTMLLEEAERILKELQDRDFTALNNTVNQELSFIESVSDNAKMLLNETLGLHNEARRARELIAKLKGEFNGLLDKVMGILKNVSMAEQWNEKSKKYDSMTPIMKAQAKKEQMESSLKMVQEILGKASSSLMNATRNFEHFNGSFGRLDDLIRQVYDRFKNLTMATDMLRPLAAKASNHSEVLRKQAKILEDLLTDTQQFAEKAINASKAYSNIASKLNEALEIARQAEGNATEAQEKSKAVNTRAKATNADSQNLANSSSSVKDRVDNHLQKLLDGLKDRIAQLKKKIMSVEDDLGMINNTFDDINKYGDMGAKAKSAQQNATDSEMMADDAYRIAIDIESQLPGLKDLQNSIVAANKNITEAEKEIGDAVNKSMHIKERIQIVHVNQTRILKDLKEDVLDVIQEIQDMLSDSRELLNKMSVVLDFQNDTITNPIAPPVSRDFSTIKDIELFIKPRVTDALLLYLGPSLNIKKRKIRQADETMCENDFVSLELKAAKVVAFACVSGKLITLISSEKIKVVAPGTTTAVKPPPGELTKPILDPWYKIHFYMSGESATLSFEYYESNKKPIIKSLPQKTKIDVPNPLLRIDKDNNFLLVGGIPNGVKVPPNINTNKYIGPMDGLRIDFLPVGLWDAQTLYVEGKKFPSVFYDRLAFQPKRELNTYRFNGHGYLKVGYYTTTQMSRVSFTFKTTESRGLLLMAVRDRRPEVFMMMDIINSTFRLTYNQGGGIRTLMASTPCDDGRDHVVSLLEDPETRQHFTLTFDSEVLANRRRYYDTRGADLVTAEYIYFGGRERGQPTPLGVDFGNIVDFSGCIANPTIATALKEVITSVGFERTCVDRPVRYLTLLAPDSYLVMDGLAINARSFTLSISFRTRQKTGIFLHQSHQTMDFFSLGMIGGRVVLKADTGGSVKTLQTDLDNYDDGGWYHVSVVKNGPEISLHVGYEHKKAQFDVRLQSIQTGSNPLYVGGLPKNYEAKNQKVFFSGVKFNLAGTTLRDLVFKGELESFLNYREKLKVIFDEEDFPLPRPRDFIIPKQPTTPPMYDPTDKPKTTEPITTLEPTTMEPTTMEPTTMEPTTMEPTTMEATTLEPTTMEPTTMEPTTMEATTLEATTMEPTTMEPTTMEPTTMEPTTMEPTTMEPTTMEPTTMEPTTMEPTTMEPTTMEPTTMEPTIMATTPTRPTGCITGPELVRDNTINSFSDDPNSYAKYEKITKDQVMRKVVGSRTKISLEFRTLGQDGVLFYSASGERQADFLACYLLSGKVKCRFSAGSGIGDLVSTKTYNDQKWHTLLFTRKLKVGTLKINNEKIATVTARGGSTNVDGLSDFYIGGVPKGYNTKRIQERQAAKSFPGCIRNFMVSSKDPGAADDLSGVVGCVTSDVEPGSFFDGGFIKLVEAFRVGLKKTVMLEIKPRVDTATIFSTINKGGDYLVLELLKGDLILRVDNGNGPFEVRYSPSDKKELCDGQWHRIRIDKDRNTASLVVDSNDPIKVKGKGSLSNTDVKDPLYVGGVPDGFTHKALKTTARYKGCIRGFLDNEKKIPLSSPVEKTGELFVNGCPVALP